MLKRSQSIKNRGLHLALPATISNPVCLNQSIFCFAWICKGYWYTSLYVPIFLYSPSASHLQGIIKSLASALFYHCNIKIYNGMERYVCAIFIIYLYIYSSIRVWNNFLCVYGIAEKRCSKICAEKGVVTYVQIW